MLLYKLVTIFYFILFYFTWRMSNTC